MNQITGKCLCEAVCYRIEGELGPIFNCHCSKCRRWHGAAFRTRASIDVSQFTWISGEDKLSSYQSSENVTKYFCHVCGSPLISTYKDRPAVLGVPLGGLEGEIQGEPETHIFTGSKASWYKITDDLPQYETWPGGESKVRQTRTDMKDLSNLNEPQAFAAIWSETQAYGFDMPSEPLTGSLLRTLAASKPSARFLELGSGTGLSTAWLLDGMDSHSHLTTVDNNESLLSILKTHLGRDPRLTVVCADGDEFLRSIRGQHFDFIFADTWSGKYRLLDDALELLSPSGLYVIDDMLPQPNWPDGHAEKVSDLIAKLEQREDLHLTKLSWASGVIVASKQHF
jgi:predicted O-methyltransferase YrrM